MATVVLDLGAVEGRQRKRMYFGVRNARAPVSELRTDHQHVPSYFITEQHPAPALDE